ncbi:MAG: selenocysteine-specific translation elongation factor [Vicinamibacterales bacterium]
MPNIVVGTAGHIDHGKSTLVFALTGTDPDRLKEEKERGITIELGFAHATIGDTRVAFVDVPGHERFVRTMLAGVGGIDCVLLIVACDESVMPQTREHFDICRLLHVPEGIVVLTKSDTVEPEMRALVRDDVWDLVRGSFLETAQVVEVSARTGAGLDELRHAIVACSARIAARPANGAARLPIDRAFSMRGFGTVVTGTLVSGRIEPDDELALLPGSRVTKVRGVQVHGASTREAIAGQRTALNLGGLEVGDVDRGQTLATPGTLSVTRRVDAAFDLLATAKPLKHGGRVRVHYGTSEILGRVSIAGAATAEIAPGKSALIRLRLESPAALTRADRFIVRAYSPPVTIGGGHVLDPAPSRPGVRSESGLVSLQKLSGTTGSAELEALEAMAVAIGVAGMSVGELVSRGGVSPSSIASTVDALVKRGGLERVGEQLISAATLRRYSDALVQLVTAFHRAHPLSDGVPREEARERVFGKADPAAFEWTVKRLVAQQVLVGAERLALASHRVSVSGEEARVKSSIAEVYRAAGLTPPDAATLASLCKATPRIIESMTALLTRERVLARVDTLLFHSEALQTLRKDVTAMKNAVAGGRATVDVAQFKDRFEVSRKFAIPLLEYLDRERVTRREGDVRVIL